MQSARVPISAFFKCLTCTVHCTHRVEWFTTFCDFRKATGFWQSGIFLEFQFLKIRKFRYAQSFHFQKITGTFKIYNFFKFAETFIINIKEQFPKNNSKTNLYLSFSSLLAFKNQRIHPRGRRLQKLFYVLLFLG